MIHYLFVSHFWKINAFTFLCANLIRKFVWEATEERSEAFRHFFGEARGGLSGGLNLDEIDAANSFLMLPMVRNGLKWPILSQFVAYFSYFHVNLQCLFICHGRKPRFRMKKSWFRKKNNDFVRENHDFEAKSRIFEAKRTKPNPRTRKNKKRRPKPNPRTQKYI